MTSLSHDWNVFEQTALQHARLRSTKYRLAQEDGLFFKSCFLKYSEQLGSQYC